MTAPVPYESRVRPLIAAALPTPWRAHFRPDGSVHVGSSKAQSTVSDNDPGVTVALSDSSALVVVTAVNTAAASADLAEAVRAYRDANLAIVHHEIAATMGFPGPMRGAVADRVKAVDAMLAALARLDAAGASS